MSATQHGFKAEVQQLLNLMIHSVYSDREIFLRELLSNAADALDKARFLGLTNPELRSPINPERMGIRVIIDEEAGTLTLADDGIGMTEEEANTNLGTIAHSGTRAFLDSHQEAGDSPDLIGQFGLGFYSAFMVADEVVVETCSGEADAPGVRWTSQGEGTYEVEPWDGQHRGTSVTLRVREDSREFLDEARIREIIKRHSNFLPWPIDLGEAQVNSGKALWVESPSQVTEEEATQFYHAIAMDWMPPALRVHMKVDSPLQIAAMLFVPSQRPHDLFYPDMKKGPRLYARRVLIDEYAKDLLPDWLRFVRGVVDSEDVPLNVSREMVQKTPTVRKIRDTVVKRILKELNRFAAAPVPEQPEPEEGEENPAPPPQTYADIWRNFGALLKEGYFHERADWGEQLLPLMRFNTTRHETGDGLCSLAEYREAMAEDQDTIWYLTAESREAALTSPHLEAFKKKGWEVLLLTESVDEWFVQGLETFDDLPVRSVSRGELSLDEDEEHDELLAFTPWIQDVLGEVVAGVRSSTRLTDSACVLVDDENGMSANMERILRAANQSTFGGAQRVLEVNPSHPLIQSLAQLHASGDLSTAEPLVRLLYDDALLLEGTVSEPAAMGRRLQALLTEAAASAASRAEAPSPDSA